MLDSNEKYAMIFAAIQGKKVTVREISLITGESKEGVTHYLKKLMQAQHKHGMKLLTRTVMNNKPTANKLFPFQYIALVETIPPGVLEDGRKKNVGSSEYQPSGPLWGGAPESTVRGVKNKNKLGYEGENGIVRLSNVSVRAPLKASAKIYPSGSSLDGTW